MFLQLPLDRAWFGWELRDPLFFDAMQALDRRRVGNLVVLLTLKQ